MSYRPLPDAVGELEEAVLARWIEEKTFARSLEARKDDPEFVFYEGPPTANGRPGVHHVMARTLKDTIARFHAMTGHHVTRKAGWDTHGLPVELEVEKLLGISGKPDIEKLGIGEFNRVCRENLFTYKEEWERLSQRIGYWLDYDDPYITCSPEYVESVWWALSEIENKGLLYLGYKVLPYCPRCGTGLSSHEVAQGYADRTDPSITVRFPVVGQPGRYLLVWTTTPWTLVSNVAVAFGPDVSYVEVEHQGDRYVLARSRVEHYFGEEASIAREVDADELEGLEYERPLRLDPDYDVATGRVLPADFVSDEDGTGLVHTAPAFGADDFAFGQAFDLPVVRPVDDAGRFEPDVAEVGGVSVKDADGRLQDLLEDRGLMFRRATFRHSYPHCWRCDTPLIYMARDSWYVRTTDVKRQMMEENAAVGWHPPEIGAGRMGEWLANNIDWAISRDRYWGTPLPIWTCGECDAREVVGSYAELAERAGELADDFDPHRPEIDEPTWACSAEGCGGTMTRIPQVLDAWFDSGSMPFAQWHYPFENEDRFTSHFPADAIAEGVDQTRGWFYSLLALSTILFGRSAYRNVLVNDLILDESGQKMSKSRGNVVDPWETLAEHGADVLRFYLLASSNPWLPKRWDGEALHETNRKMFDTLRSTYRFFVMYAELEGWRHDETEARPPSDRPLIDRWLIGRAQRTAADVRRALSTYDLTRAARTISSFVQDDLSNWYVRLTRDRFWATRGGEEAADDTSDAFATLHEALVTVCRLLAPIAPFLSDWMHRELVGTSVHLADFPGEAPRVDESLERGMEDVRRLATLGRAAREEAGIRVRQPLGRLHAMLPDGRRLGDELLDLLRSELNVHDVVFPAADADIIRLSAKPDFGVLGPRFGPDTPAVARAIAGLEGEVVRRLRDGETVSLEAAGRTLEIGPGDARILEQAAGELLVQAEDGWLVGLDPTLDEGLRAEGRAREIVSRVQRLRRDAGFEVSDRIRLAVAGPEAIEDAVAAHDAYIGGETLAVSLECGTAAVDRLAVVREVDIDDAQVRIGLEVATDDAGVVG
ncbi:MAG: isoleucine--tRNA ligase [Gemmatimonadales bacterium]|jgi:isoleucyl-tRNA synthetase